MTGAAVAHEPADLLRMARAVLGRADPDTAGLWPRASALLAQRALETVVRRWWEERAMDLGGCPMRVQLIFLRTYFGDAELAARAGHAWSALSRACHHHAYELAPTAAELRAWLEVVEQLVRPPGAKA